MKKITKTEARKILEGMVKKNIKMPDGVTVKVLNMLITEVPIFTKYGVPLIYKRFITNASYEEIAEELHEGPSRIPSLLSKEVKYIRKYIDVYRANIKANNDGITLETDFLTTCYSEFSTKRIHNSLYRAGIDTFGDVKKLIESVESKPVYLPFSERCKVKNLGPKGYAEMVAIFKSHGGETL